MKRIQDVLFSIAFAAMLALAGCGGGGGGGGGGGSDSYDNDGNSSGSGGDSGGAPAQTVTIAITPQVAAIKTGETVKLTATVSAGEVLWPQISGLAVNGNNATFITYTTGSFKITVTAANDSSKTATATITVSESPPGVPSISVAPTSANIQTGEALTLTATANNSSVTWRTTGGTLTPSGNSATFTSGTPGTYTVTAIATIDTSTTATATVTVGGATGTSPGAIEMVFVEGGTFTMGCTAGQEDDCYYDSAEERPHLVTLSNFYIGKTEVTQAQWKAVMGADDPALLRAQTYFSYFSNAGDNNPMTWVSWDDITKPNGFLAKLNAQTGKNYRLPTEAEWEYAARGGKNGIAHDYKYSGSNVVDDVAWYARNTLSAGHLGPQPVGTKAANELGIHDMSGNVSEWVSDWYDRIYYEIYGSSSVTNPQGPSTGSARVFRGGGWSDPSPSSYLRVGVRDSWSPESYSFDRGFRLADGNNGGTDTAIKMVKVQGGTFTMGCTAGQANDCYYDEKPTHSVTLSDFYIGKTEVTQAQWKAVMGANDPVLRNVLTVHSNQAGDDRPMILVSWDDITKSDGFLAKLNAQTGKNYRLPTEAEWEYAARGGKDGVVHDYKYSGSNIADDVAWYFGTIGYDYTGPIAVGAKAANELGIHDMSGNVSEWVSDWYGIDYYLSSPTTNPQGPSTGSSRVLRGGSFGNPAASIGVSHRNRSGPDYQFSSLGFRLASSSE